MLSQLISPSDIKVNLESSENEECFAELLEIMHSKQPQIVRAEALNALCTREEKSSTAVFPYVAVPHAVCKSVKNISVALGISRKGIEFASPIDSDKKNPLVNVVFQILFDAESDLRISLLKDILQLVSTTDFVSRVLTMNNPVDIFELLQEYDM